MSNERQFLHPDPFAPVVLLSVEALTASREQSESAPDGQERMWRMGYGQGHQFCRLLMPALRSDEPRMVRMLEVLGLEAPALEAEGGDQRLRWDTSGYTPMTIWLMAGIVSGLWSHGLGREVLALPDGDPARGLLLRDRERWGPGTRARYRAEEEAQAGVMQSLAERIARVAPLEMSLLLTGESGVGKERTARQIHRLSGRSAGPFVTIDCGALPEGVLESELFGHAQGAFTGAHRDRPGLFESAAGGTVFLDEIAEMPLALQPRLLRVLQEREVRRVGENRARKVDVRVLAATHHDLAERVRQRLFREDLFFRLRVVELHLPPLRERQEDILPLARQMVEQAAARHHLHVTGLSPEAEHLLRRWRWPGNVRELENAIEHAAALCHGGVIRPADLPPELHRAPPAPQRLEDVERAHILSVLAGQHYNQLRAATALGIGPSTLYRKLRRWRQEGRLPEEFVRHLRSPAPAGSDDLEGEE